LFACSFSQVRERIDLIESQHHAENVWELIRHVKILVRDVAKKLLTSNDGQRPEQDGRDDITEHPRYCYPTLFP